MNKKLFLIIIPLVLIGIVGFRLALKSNQNTITSSIDTFDRTNLHHLILKVGGADCVSCLYGMEQTLKSLPGVVNATVGVAGKVKVVSGIFEARGEVVYDTTKINPDKMMQAILPYKGVVLSDEATTVIELAPLSKTFVL